MAQMMRRISNTRKSSMLLVYRGSVVVGYLVVYSAYWVTRVQLICNSAVQCYYHIFLLKQQSATYNLLKYSKRDTIESCYQKQSEEYDGANDEKDFELSQRLKSSNLLSNWKPEINENKNQEQSSLSKVICCNGRHCHIITIYKKSIVVQNKSNLLLKNYFYHT